MQNHYNLIYREEEREMNPLCEDEGIGLIPWSPLARGLLAGNRKKTDALFSGETVRAQSDEFSNTLYSKSVENDFEIIDRVVGKNMSFFFSAYIVKRLQRKSL